MGKDSFQELKMVEELMKRDAICRQNQNIIIAETNRVIGVARNAGQIMNDIDSQFKRYTGLNEKDMLFLTTAIALQCLRIYAIDPLLKKRKKAGTNDEGGRKNHAEPGWYHAKTEMILSSRVPFDSMRYGSVSTVQGLLKGGTHRQVTLGHDPILGWIFGTANILTNTITFKNLESAHVKYVAGKGNVIHSLADTGKIFTSCGERFDENWDGKLALTLAVVREAIHLKSDVNTVSSLPLPVISTISPEFAKKLAQFGIDTASVGMVGVEAGLSMLINTLISILHRLCCDESVEDPKLYEVRTRKILTYSNSIASASNVISSYLYGQATGNWGAAVKEHLDIGGIIVTISRLFSGVSFIEKVRREYIQNEFFKQIHGQELKFQQEV